jgi:hypothetical protein
MSLKKGIGGGKENKNKLKRRVGFFFVLRGGLKRDRPPSLSLPLLANPSKFQPYFHPHTNFVKKSKFLLSFFLEILCKEFTFFQAREMERRI